MKKNWYKGVTATAITLAMAGAAFTVPSMAIDYDLVNGDVYFEGTQSWQGNNNRFDHAASGDWSLNVNNSGSGTGSVSISGNTGDLEISISSGVDASNNKNSVDLTLTNVVTDSEDSGISVSGNVSIDVVGNNQLNADESGAGLNIVGDSNVTITGTDKTDESAILTSNNGVVGISPDTTGNVQVDLTVENVDIVAQNDHSAMDIDNADVDITVDVDSTVTGYIDSHNSTVMLNYANQQSAPYTIRNDDSIVVDINNKDYYTSDQGISEEQPSDAIQDAIDTIDKMADKTEWTIHVDEGEYERFTVLSGMDGLTVTAEETTDDGYEQVNVETCNNSASPSPTSSGFPDSGGISIRDADDVTIEGLNIHVGSQSSPWYSAAISNYSESGDKGDDLHVKNCDISGENQEGLGVFINTGTTSFEVTGSTFTGLKEAISMYGDGTVMDEARVSNNTFDACSFAIHGYYGGTPDDGETAGILHFKDNMVTGTEDLYSKIIVQDQTNTGAIRVDVTGNTFENAVIGLVNLRENGETVSDVMSSNKMSISSFYVEAVEPGTIDFYASYQVPESAENQFGHWEMHDTSGTDWTDEQTAYIAQVIDEANRNGSRVLSFTSMPGNQDLIKTFTWFKDAIYWVSDTGIITIDKNFYDADGNLIADLSDLRADFNVWFEGWADWTAEDDWNNYYNPYIFYLVDADGNLTWITVDGLHDAVELTTDENGYLRLAVNKRYKYGVQEVAVEKLVNGQWTDATDDFVIDPSIYYVQFPYDEEISNLEIVVRNDMIPVSDPPVNPPVDPPYIPDYPDYPDIPDYDPPTEDIDDEEPPLVETPDEEDTEEIVDEETPLTPSIPDEEVDEIIAEIEDEVTPLASVPQTGAEIPAAAAALPAGVLALAVSALVRRLRRKD